VASAAGAERNPAARVVRAIERRPLRGGTIDGDESVGTGRREIETDDPNAHRGTQSPRLCRHGDPLAGAARARADARATPESADACATRVEPSCDRGAHRAARATSRRRPLGTIAHRVASPRNGKNTRRRPPVTGQRVVRAKTAVSREAESRRLRSRRAAPSAPTAAHRSRNRQQAPRAQPKR